MSKQKHIHLLTTGIVAAAVSLTAITGTSFVAQVVPANTAGGAGGSSAQGDTMVPGASLSADVIAQAIKANGGHDVCFETGTTKWEGNVTVCNASGWTIYRAQDYGLQPATDGGTASSQGQTWGAPSPAGNGGGGMSPQPWMPPQQPMQPVQPMPGDTGTQQPYQGLMPIQNYSPLNTAPPNPNAQIYWINGVPTTGSPQGQQNFGPANGSMQGQGSADMFGSPKKQMEKEVKKLANQIKRTEKKMANLEKRIANTQKKIDKENAKLEKTDDEEKIERIEERIEFYEEMMMNMEEGVEDMQDGLDEMRAALEELQEELADAKDASSAASQQ
ncbi:MAG: hypothetical protein WCV62_03840 [Candidatus Peribacteraceae bacterium]|jgi:hypothetical protein